MCRAGVGARNCVLAIAAAAFCWRVLAANASEVTPQAPTLPDAHQYFESLVVSNGVSAVYETISKSGEVLGYQRFPVNAYRGDACNSVITLKNGVKVDIDWSVVSKSQPSDGTLSIIESSGIEFRFLHMIYVEGGVDVEPSSSIPRLILAINEELSRNRLANAIELLSSTCRSKSKFD